MQTSLNDRIVDSEILSNDKEKVETMSKALTDMNTGKIDKITIASFKEGETVELKGLKFKISSNNMKVRRLILKML